MPQVNVPGVGQLNFPDNMSQPDMAAAIQRDFPEIHQAGVLPPASPQQAAPQPGLKQLNPSDVPQWGRENPNTYAAFMTAKDMMTPPDQPSGPGALKAQMEQIVPAAIGGTMTGKASSIFGTTGKAGPGLIQRTLLGMEKGAMESPYAQESRRLAEKLNVPMTVGQETGNAGTLKVESALSQQWRTADKMSKFYDQQINALDLAFQKAATNISKDPKTAGDWAIGENVKSTFTNLVKAAVGKRSANWKNGMKAVEKVAGNNRFIQTDNLKEAVMSRLKELGDDLSGGAEPEKQALKTMLENLKFRGSGLSASEAQNQLSRFSKGSAGGGKLFSTLDDGTDRAISSKFLSAFNKDLDATAESGSLGEAANALKAVRSQYATDSMALESTKNSKLGQILGGKIDRGTGLPVISGDAVTARIVNLKPGEIMDVRDLLKEHAPDVLQDVKRNILGRVLSDKSGDAVFKGLRGEGTFSPRRVGANYGKMRDQWNALTTTEERKQIEDVMSMMARAAKSEASGSQTAGRLEVMQLFKALANPVASGAGVVVKGFGADTAAKILIDPAGRKALRTMAITSPTSKPYGTAAAVLNTIIAEKTKSDQR